MECLSPKDPKVWPRLLCEWGSSEHNPSPVSARRPPWERLLAVGKAEGPTVRGGLEFPFGVPGAPPALPRQECGRATAWQPRGPPPRREETAARLSWGSRASQAMTIFQPPAPAG
jgi:hypothetical protein